MICGHEIFILYFYEQYFTETFIKICCFIIFFEYSKFDTFTQVTHYWLEQKHACLQIILFTKFVALIGLICKEEVGNKAYSSE